MVPLHEPTSSRPGGSAHGRALSPQEFAAQFEDARATLWFVAAAVLGDRSEAEDAVQEAAVTALRKLDEFDPGTRFAAWMGQIVRNVARNYIHKRARRQTAPTDTRDLDRGSARPAPESGPVLNTRGDLSPGQESFDDRLLAALRELDETPRICLLLRAIGEKSYRDISLILGIPEGTAMSHVHRARRALRDRLAPAHPGERR